MKLISNALTLFIIIALAVMVLHGKHEQQASTDLSEDDLFCMVQNVYHEARDQSLLGQAAVAHVTLNRVKSPAYLIPCVTSFGRTASLAGRRMERATA